MKTNDIEKKLKNTIKSICREDARFIQEMKKRNRDSEEFNFKAGMVPVAFLVGYEDNWTYDDMRIIKSHFAGAARYLSKETFCHLFYVKKQLDDKHLEEYTAQISKWSVDNGVKIIIDLCDLENYNKATLDIRFYCKELCAFVESFVRCFLEYEWKKLGNTKEGIYFKRDIGSGLIKNTKQDKESSFSVTIDKSYIDMKDSFEAFFVIDSLRKIVKTLSNIEWDASQIQVYKVGVAKKHKPQDVVYINKKRNSNSFKDKSYLYLCNYRDRKERVRLHYIQCVEENSSDDVLFLTNRLIELMFEREWLIGDETESSLEGAPIILYEGRINEYSIGMPKADKIDKIYFSSELYKTEKNNANKYDFVVYNRYTDSSIHIDFDGIDYGDNGRVKENGNSAPKIMLPKYHRRLLGYLDYPLKRIRKEEYEMLLQDLQIKEAEQFEKCYEAIEDEVFYSLKKNCLDQETYSDVLKSVGDIQKGKGIFSNVELLKIPKMPERKNKLKQMGYDLRDKMLSIFIGKANYLLRVDWASETDDRNNVARLNSNMMNLIGVSENDKIIVKFGKKQESLRVLANDELTDYEVGVPAPTRKHLGMNSVNDIVTVHRDMVHTFFRHSEAQTITILGTILTVSELTTVTWLRIVLGIICGVASLFLVLNEERIKVK